MKKLLIVESPAKIKTISKFLGKEFKILSTLGHVKDLPQKTLGIAVNDGFALDYEILAGKEKTVAEICKEAAKSDEIYLAPDPDREGEIIAWHIDQEIEKVVKDTSKIHRITFNEITKTAIENAIAHPQHIDLNKVGAQQARRVLDRLVGYEVSPILWQKLTKGLSAGRVQSVALKLICNREEAIRVFKPEEYWSIEGLFATPKGAKFSAELTHIQKKKIEIKNEAQAKEIVDKASKASYAVESVKDTKRLKNANAPFMTSTLQQAAYNSLGFAVQRTMQIAQNLYEGIALEDASTPVALITYMRTDSLRIADSALTQARSFITKSYGKEYLPAQAQVYAKGKAQDAHEAIRPIDVTITPHMVARYASSEVSKLYEIIWKRFVASQMKPAQYAQRQVVITGGIYQFKVTGSTLIFDGFLKVYNHEEDDKEQDTTKVKIPAEVAEGLPVNLDKLDPKQHFTQAPPRFTEATLVKELEKERIGRPSTYATILKTIQARAYTSLDNKKRFVPTELGMVVTKMLNDNLPKIMDVSFTAVMEEDLDKIAQGEMKRDILLKQFYTEFEKDLEAFRGGQARRPSEKTELTCPTCNTAHLLIRFGKSGPFVGCSGYPECKFTSNFTRTETGDVQLVATEAPQVLDEKCPQCEKPMRQMSGKFGQFVACTGYPKCKYIKPIIAGFKCTTCKKGDIIQKWWKGKKFWGCSQYPDCNFSIPGDIEEVPCSMCKAPYMLKRLDKAGNTTLLCADKNCGNKQEIPVQ